MTSSSIGSPPNPHEGLRTGYIYPDFSSHTTFQLRTSDGIYAISPNDTHHVLRFNSGVPVTGTVVVMPVCTYDGYVVEGSLRQ